MGIRLSNNRYEEIKKIIVNVLIHKFKLTCAEEIANIFEISYEAACYAYSYYKKWLRYGSSQYTDYEEVILQLFANAS